MASAQVYKRCISTTGRGNGEGRDERRPLELFGAGKDNRGRKGEKLKGILPRGLDGREDAAIFGFNLLVMLLVVLKS